MVGDSGVLAGGQGDHAPPAKIFRGRQTTIGALKFSAKTLKLLSSLVILN